MAAKIVRSDPAAEGIRRRRCGRGFSYLGTDAVVIKDARTLTRIRSLVIHGLGGRLDLRSTRWADQAVGTASRRGAPDEHVGLTQGVQELSVRGPSRNATSARPSRTLVLIWTNPASTG